MAMICAMLPLLIEESAIRHGHGGIAWPYVSEELIFGLVLDRVTPHSTRYNLLIGVGAVTIVTAPIWAPIVGRAFVGATMTTPAMWERFKVWLQAGSGQVNQSAVSVGEKLQRYLLNPSHPQGKHKAEFFRQALGYTQSNMARLAEQIVFNPATARATEFTQYGQKFVQFINIVGANGRTVEVKTVWIRNLDGVVRLITAYPR